MAVGSRVRAPLLGMARLLGRQGALAQYCVSQYLLAAHLGTALALYRTMFASAMSVIEDWRIACTGSWGRLRDGRTWEDLLHNQLVRRFKAHAAVVTGLIFLTALSGTSYSLYQARWGLGQRVPLMGVCLAPPLDELFSPSYADAADRGKGTWCNLFENLTTVQFDHCVIEMTMYLAMALLFMSIRRAAVRGALPPPALRATAATFAKVNVQAALGISSLLYLRRAALGIAPQRPGAPLIAAARAWRQANSAREAAAKGKVA
ncbi:COX15/CtaA family [Lactarius tabidus]